MRFEISESFSNSSAGVNCCTALKARIADVYAGWNKSMLHIFLPFILFLFFYSCPPTLFLHHYHGSISCKVPSISSFKSWFCFLQCIICSSLLLCYLSCMNQHLKLIHTGKRKISCAHTQLYSQSHHSPALLMFSPLISAQPWSTLVWSHTT